jgi:hypothetical protein
MPLGSRPAYVVWLRPQGSLGEPAWPGCPKPVVERWNQEVVGGKETVFWETPGSLGALDESAFARRIVGDLRRSTEARTHDVRVSVLFVWDCVDAGPDTLAQCIDSTEALTRRLRGVMNANITLFPRLQASRVEILLRLPAQATIPGDRESQKRWIGDVERRLMKADDVGRATVTRLWVVGGSNEDDLHPRGITASEERSLDGMLAEIVTLWIQADLGKAVESREHGGRTGVASLGVARLLYDGAALSSYLSRKRAASVLAELRSESDKVKDVKVDACVDFLANGMSITPDVPGLSAENVVRLLLRPEQLTPGMGEGGPNDLKNAASLADASSPTDTESGDIEATFGIPAQIMTHADLGMSQRLLRAARAVRNARTYLFAKTYRKLMDECESRLADRAYPYLRQSRQRQSRWREWLEMQQERVSAAVEAAFAAPDDAGMQGMLGEVVPEPAGPRSQVPEEDPRPEDYSERLAKLLAERPLNVSTMTRSLLGALVSAYVLAEGGGQLNPIPDALPIIGSPWFLAVFVPVLWLSSSFFNLWLRRNKRQRALRALYLALSKHARAMVKDLLKRQARQFYLDLLAVIGAPVQNQQVGEDQARADADLRRIRTEIDRVAPDLAAGLSATMTSKLDRVETTIEALQETFSGTQYQTAIEDNPWAQNVVARQHADTFPFLTPEARDISGSPRDEADILGDMVGATGLCATIWKEAQGAPNLPSERISVLAGEVAGWMRTTGYAYLERVAFSHVLEHLAKYPLQPGGLMADQWKAFLERAAHPTLAIPCDSTFSFRVVTPPDRRDILDAVLLAYPDTPFADGIEAPGLVACRIRGPAPWASLPLLPLPYSQQPGTPGQAMEVLDV